MYSTAVGGGTQKEVKRKVRRGHKGHGGRGKKGGIGH